MRRLCRMWRIMMKVFPMMEFRIWCSGTGKKTNIPLFMCYQRYSLWHKLILKKKKGKRKVKVTSWCKNEVKKPSLPYLIWQVICYWWKGCNFASQIYDNIVFLFPSSFKLSEVSVTAKKKKYYYCKVYFRSIEHVDSCLKYYMDGIREFFIDTKSKKVHSGNCLTNYFMSKRQDIAQKKRSWMINDRYMALPYLDKNTLYEEMMRNKKRNIKTGVVYADTISILSMRWIWVFPLSRA